MDCTLRGTARGFNSCLLVFLGAAALAQAPAVPPEVRVFHPNGPASSYEVATIKPSDPAQPYSGTTLRRYIAGAYGVPIPWGAPATLFAGAQVVGGPAWIDKDRYDIKGKAADDLREAMAKMSHDERDATTHTMQQALLAERFHLKVHFETREMQIFEAVPARGGLKIAPAAPVDDKAEVAGAQKDKMPAGSMGMQIRLNGTATLEGRATNMELFLNALRGESPEVAGRPIVDMTGFKGNFDVKDFRFSGVPLPTAGEAVASSSDPDVPTLAQALEQQFGLRLVPAKGQVEIVVIDSIDRPTEN
jgi:bla regulator protein blaR1